MGKYSEIFDRSLKDPEGFWGEAASLVDWFRPWDKVLDASDAPFTRCFVGGQINTCHNALDRHLSDRGGQPAIIHDSPVTGSKRTVTYSELHGEVSRLAGLLARLGVGKGDRVIIYMPMIPETLFAMLACCRIGAVRQDPARDDEEDRRRRRVQPPADDRGSDRARRGEEGAGQAGLPGGIMMSRNPRAGSARPAAHPQGNRSGAPD